MVWYIDVRVGSLEHVQGSSGSFWFACGHSGGHSSHRVHSGTRGFTKARIGVVEYIRVQVSSLGNA